MFGIVVALKKEAEYFLNTITNKVEFKLGDKPAYSGSISGKELVLVISGIGKVSAAISTQLLIDKYSPDFILNFGTAGGMAKDLEIGEYVICESAMQYDFDVTYLDDVKVGYIQEYDRVLFPCATINNISLKKVNVASGDRFNDDINDINTIANSNCSVRDMEGGAIAQTCLTNSIPLVMVKGITDVYGKTPSNFQFYDNLVKLCKGFPAVLESVIKAYSK